MPRLKCRQRTGTVPAMTRSSLMNPIHLLPPETGPQKKIYVDGVEAFIVAERVTYLDGDGKLVTESLHDYTRKALHRRFASLDDFLNRWNAAERKQALIDEIASEGLPLTVIGQELNKDLDPFDLVCHVAFDAKPLTRRERAENVKKRDVFTKYGGQARAVLGALLDKYADEGVLNLDDANVLKIPPLDTLGTPVELVRAFGEKPDFRAGRARSSIRTLQGDCLRDVRQHAGQIHSEHHAPGRGRRRRRPAHQPAVLDVLPQDHRRPRPGTRTPQGRLPLARSLPVFDGGTGLRIRKASRARNCSNSSTASSFRS